MSSCPMCACGGFSAIFHGSDRLYHTTTKRFSVVRCLPARIKRPRRLARSRTPAFHADNTGSNPVGVILFFC